MLTTHFHERGRAQGRAEGLAEGSRHILQRVLEARFGALPGHLLNGLAEETDVARLEDLAVRAVTCGSLEEFERALGEQA